MLQVIHNFLSYGPGSLWIGSGNSRYVGGMKSRTDELEEMKRIDLCQYAASRGFVVDRKQSSRSSAVLKHPNGDKLIVAKNRNGQFMYFNAKGNDNGTIIDFVQTRERCSLGEVRKLLRPWVNGSVSPAPEPTFPIDLQPSEHDVAQVLGRWLQAKLIGQTHPYLENERGVYERWRSLATTYAVTGVNSHDMRIVAAMIRHGIPALLTTNAGDFNRYAEIEVLTPEMVTNQR